MVKYKDDWWMGLGFRFSPSEFIPNPEHTNSSYQVLYEQRLDQLIADWLPGVIGTSSPSPRLSLSVSQPPLDAGDERRDRARQTWPSRNVSFALPTFDNVLVLRNLII